MYTIVLMVLKFTIVNVKTMREIFSNYVCFSKSPNFNDMITQVLNSKVLLTTKGVIKL